MVNVLRDRVRFFLLVVFVVLGVSIFLSIVSPAPDFSPEKIEIGKGIFLLKSCKTLDRPNSVYIQRGNIDFNGKDNCILINAPNVTFDCRNHWIKGNSGGIAIYVNDTGAVVRNCFLKVLGEDGQGVVLNKVDNSFVTNVNSYNTEGNSFFLDGVSYSVFKDISSYGGDGIVLSDSSYNEFYDVNSTYSEVNGLVLTGSNYNKFVNLASDYNGAKGILIGEPTGSSHNEFFNLSTNYNNQRGASIFIGGSNKFVNFVSKGNKFNAFRFNLASNNVFINSLFDGSGEYQILSASSLADGNQFINTTIINTNPLFSDVKFTFGLPDDIAFINTYLDSYVFDSHEIHKGSFLFENSSAGDIYFFEGIEGSGFGLSEDIKISYNFAHIDSSSNTGFDKPSVITFYGMPGNFSNPIIYRNDIECPESICDGLTSLNDLIVSIRVSGEGDYWIGEL